MLYTCAATINHNGIDSGGILAIGGRSVRIISGFCWIPRVKCYQYKSSKLGLDATHGEVPRNQDWWVWRPDLCEEMCRVQFAWPVNTSSLRSPIGSSFSRTACFMEIYPTDKTKSGKLSAFYVEVDEKRYRFAFVTPFPISFLRVMFVHDALNRLFITN